MNEQVIGFSQDWLIPGDSDSSAHIPCSDLILEAESPVMWLQTLTVVLSGLLWTVHAGKASDF